MNLKVEIREIDTKNIEARRNLIQYAFGPSPKPLKKLDKDYNKDSTKLGLFENDELVSTATSVPHSHCVRNRIFEMAGIAAVTTDPKSKRKGYVTKLMISLLEKEKNKPFTVLYPFKESFYGRMGYITLPQARYAVFSPNKIVSILNNNFYGYVQKKQIADGYKEFEKFLKEIQPKIHGMSLQTELARERIKDENNFWLACAYNNSNELIGILPYKMEGFHKPLKANYLYYKSQGKYLLLQWLANHSDHISEIHLMLKPDDMIENWYFDIEPKVVPREWVPSPMGRVLNIEKINGLSCGEGDIKIKVKDELCSWNNGIFRFYSKNNELYIERSNKEEFELSLSIEGLSALVYGGYSIKDIHYRGWGEFNSKSELILETMFPQKLAHIHETF